MPEIYGEIERLTGLLEKHYRDVQDIEFTIQEGTLYILQTRSGKRTARAAVKSAVDMVVKSKSQGTTGTLFAAAQRIAVSSGEKSASG